MVSVEEAIPSVRTPTIKSLLLPEPVVMLNECDQFALLVSSTPVLPAMNVMSANALPTNNLLAKRNSNENESISFFIYLIGTAPTFYVGTATIFFRPFLDFVVLVVFGFVMLSPI